MLLANGNKLCTFITRAHDKQATVHKQHRPQPSHTHMNIRHARPRQHTTEYVAVLMHKVHLENATRRGTLKNTLGQAKGRRGARVIGDAYATQAHTRTVKLRQKATLVFWTWKTRPQRLRTMANRDTTAISTRQERQRNSKHTIARAAGTECWQRQGFTGDAAGAEGLCRRPTPASKAW